MTKIEPIEATPTVADIIKDTPVNGELQIHAERLASFKSTLNRINANREKGAIKIGFSYLSPVDNYFTAKRIY